MWRRKDILLTWLLVYVVVISSTTGAICYFDVVKCGHTGDTREWMLQLMAVIVSLIAGGKMENK
jgi:hypothetical protein